MSNKAGNTELSDDSLVDVGGLEHYFDDLINENNILQTEFANQDFNLEKEESFDTPKYSNALNEAFQNGMDNVVSEQEQKNVFDWVNRFFQSHNSLQTDLKKNSQSELQLPKNSLPQTLRLKNTRKSSPSSPLNSFENHSRFRKSSLNIDENIGVHFNSEEVSLISDTPGLDALSILRRQLDQERKFLLSSRFEILNQKNKLEKENVLFKGMLSYLPDVSDSDSDSSSNSENNKCSAHSEDSGPESGNDYSFGSFNEKIPSHRDAEARGYQYPNIPHGYLESQTHYLGESSSSGSDGSGSYYSLDAEYDDDSDDPDKALQSLKSLLSQYEKKDGAD